MGLSHFAVPSARRDLVPDETWDWMGYSRPLVYILPHVNCHQHHQVRGLSSFPSRVK